jgi:hypothetical protein
MEQPASDWRCQVLCSADDHLSFTISQCYVQRPFSIFRDLHRSQCKVAAPTKADWNASLPAWYSSAAAWFPPSWHNSLMSPRSSNYSSQFGEDAYAYQTFFYAHTGGSYLEVSSWAGALLYYSELFGIIRVAVNNHASKCAAVSEHCCCCCCCPW